MVILVSIIIAIVKQLSDTIITISMKFVLLLLMTVAILIENVAENKNGFYNVNELILFDEMNPYSLSFGYFIVISTHLLDWL